MNLISKIIRGATMSAAALGVTCSLNAQPQAMQRAGESADTWLQSFNAQVGRAYVLKPLDSFQSGPSVKDIYIELIDLKRHQSELVAFENKISLGVGCFIYRNLEHEAPQHLLCQKQAHKKIESNQLLLPECSLGSEPKYANHPGALYFVSRQGTEAVCIYKMPAQLDESWFRKLQKSADDLLVTMLEPIWEVNQQEGVRPNNTGLLAYFFPNAPIAQLFNEGINGPRNCLRLPVSLGGFATEKTINIYRTKTPVLRQPELRWAYLYLVRSPMRVTCGDARYDIDVLNWPLAYGLVDNTMLVRGQRSVLRIRVNDGSTDAPGHLTKSVPPQKFIETMQADGGAECQSDDENAPCKWLSQQDWYTFKSKYPDDGNVGEQLYSKFWLQGFDQAIKRVFFKQGE